MNDKEEIKYIKKRTRGYTFLHSRAVKSNIGMDSPFCNCIIELARKGHITFKCKRCGTQETICINDITKKSKSRIKNGAHSYFISKTLVSMSCCSIDPYVSTKSIIIREEVRKRDKI
jgi:hypothetical protein